ncbi:MULTISPECIES: hypothetical protein [Paenibacillus]|uniref:hypothetical protein n=1 Tax=Paenibacillus TaxID=44249 RepID=UPI0015E83EC6|nr:hypothetical protein [Paenibacillus sp. tmac-D7]
MKTRVFPTRSDIAIVRTKSDEYEQLSNNIEDVLAIIELKFKGYATNIDPFNKDIKETQKYLNKKKYRNGQFYLGFIHEAEYPLAQASWLTKRQQNSWARGKLTELSGFYNDDKG